MLDYLQVLKQFLTGINGGGPGTRSEYAFDNLNIPAVCNPGEDDCSSV